MAHCIIELLNAEENDIEGFYDFMERHFAFEKVAEDWLNLFNTLGHQNTPLSYINETRNRLMSLREWNRRLKVALPFGYCLPTIDFYRSILRRFGLVKDF